MPRHSRAVVAAGLALLAAAAARAQEPPPQQPPVFRAAAELVAVDVSVVDDKGNPVADLQPGHFRLEVDGKPRTIRSVDYVARPSRGPAPAGDPGRVTTNVGAERGQLIVIVVDQGNIRRGQGRAAMAAAGRFLDRLSPADRVALAVIPHGPRVEFTTDVQKIRDTLPRVVGMASRMPTSMNIGLAEALSVSDGNQFDAATMMLRECPSGDEFCRATVMQEAMALADEANQQARQSMMTLRAIIDALVPLEGPKTLVLVSEGLPMSRWSRNELGWLPSATSAARVSIYALHLDTNAVDVADQRLSPTAAEDLRIQAEGLDTVAGLARGTMFRVAGNSDFAFERIAAELSAYYLLSFEPEGADRDGRSHKIKVTVDRPRLTVRSRAEFVVTESARPRTITAAERLVDLLGAPFPATDLPIRAATYVLRDPLSLKLRVLISAEIDVGPQPAGPIDIAYAFVGPEGTSDRALRDQLAAEPGRESGVRPWVGTVVLDPGEYTLKLAAVDPSGRAGSVSHTVRVRLTPAGDLSLADLLLADEAGTPGGLRPAMQLAPGVEVIGTYLEMYGGGSGIALERPTVTFEIAKKDALGALVRRTGTVRPLEGQARLVARSVLSIGLLPPGDYVISGVVADGDRELGRVSRPLTIPPRPQTAAAAAPAAASALAASLRADTSSFQPAQVLEEKVLGHFLNRLEEAAGASLSESDQTAIGHARSSRFTELDAALKGRSGSVLATSFLRGLKLFSEGSLENAGAQFRAALAVTSDFFPALVYLGACYAAAGRDREAAAAWQTSLITESESVVLYRLLADALIRANDTPAAVAVLREAVDTWPDDDDLLRRLGMAYAGSGQLTEALSTLVAYLDENPADQESMFVVVQMLYQAISEGRAIGSPEQDRELFTRFAARYADARGPHDALVAEWRRFVEGKE